MPFGIYARANGNYRRRNVRAAKQMLAPQCTKRSVLRLTPCNAQLGTSKTLRTASSLDVSKHVPSGEKEAPLTKLFAVGVPTVGPWNECESKRGKRETWECVLYVLIRHQPRQLAKVHRQLICTTQSVLYLLAVKSLSGHAHGKNGGEVQQPSCVIRVLFHLVYLRSRFCKNFMVFVGISSHRRGIIQTLGKAFFHWIRF